MITADYARVMARYNRWQNVSIFTAADGLGEEARRADRGAFFGSIHHTLSHLLWGDMIWTSRFAGLEAPPAVASIAQTIDVFEDWSELSDKRQALDAAIIEWAGSLSDGDLDVELTWYSGAIGRQCTAKLPIILAHFFNHQTHHRGQVHAMITAAGGKPDDTDLFIMVEEGRA